MSARSRARTRSERRARTWHDDSEIRLRLDFTNAYTGNLHLYAVDWDNYARLEDITVDDGHGPRTAKLTSSIVPGAWVHIPISVGAGGSVMIKVDRTGGLQRRPVRVVPRRRLDPATAATTATAGDDRSARRPGDLVGGGRCRRVRPGRLDRKYRADQAASRRDVHRRAGRALQLGRADDRRPRAPEPGPVRAAGEDLVRLERGPAASRLHQRLHRQPPPVCRGLGFVRAAR